MQYFDEDSCKNFPSFPHASLPLSLGVPAGERINMVVLCANQYE